MIESLAVVGAVFGAEIDPVPLAASRMWAES